MFSESLDSELRELPIYALIDSFVSERVVEHGDNFVLGVFLFSLAHTLNLLPSIENSLQIFCKVSTRLIRDIFGE